jgi:DNA-binding NarL/FixJ family response regulator
MRIIVADQEPSTRSALRMLLAAQTDMDLVGEAADLVELLSEIKANDPDLVILDWDVLGQRIDRLLDLLELFHRPPTIIAIGVHAEDRKAAMDIGVAGFAYKGEPPERLLAAIREVQQDRQSIKTEES